MRSPMPMRPVQRKGERRIVTELLNTSVAPTATETPSPRARILTDLSKRVPGTRTQGITWMKSLAVVNLALVALQPISAGFYLSGYGRAVTVHTIVAFALQLGALLQAATSVVLWWRRRVPVWVVGHSVGLLVIVFLQVGFGYNKRFWLHVPIGVGMLGGLTRLVNRLDTLRNANGAVRSDERSSVPDDAATRGAGGGGQ